MGHIFTAALLLFGVVELASSYIDLESHAHSQYEGCYTPEKKVGQCINLKKCTTLFNLLTSSTRQESDIQFLRKSQCGVEGSTPKVCCPFDRSVPSFEQENQPGLELQKLPQQRRNDEQQGWNSEQQCRNSEQQDGNSRNHGDNYFGELRGNFGLEFESFEQQRDAYVRQSENFGLNVEIYGQQGDKFEQYDDNFAKNSHVEQLASNLHLLPTNCGQDFSNRIIGGLATEFDEFPWMALLEYRTPGGFIRTSCGGALISKRYVLTAAHCLQSALLPRHRKLESVRLGEYNTATQRDCIPNGDGTHRCIEDTPLSVRIEEQIIHECYSASSIDKRYDIALLRLSRDVPFTYYIKPICLPETSNLNPKLTIAGWGATETRQESYVKLKVNVPLVDTRQCSQTYRQSGVTLGVGQFCAGGQKDFDSCRGDSGGPLMQPMLGADGIFRWEVAGVVSFGPSNCGKEGVPGVYTKVHDYKQWIIGNLRS